VGAHAREENGSRTNGNLNQHSSFRCLALQAPPALAIYGKCPNSALIIQHSSFGF
jgi:hypothetical protein